MVHDIIFRGGNKKNKRKRRENKKIERRTSVNSSSLYSSREAESENASLVVQGMLMDFECRFLERKAWRIIFDVSLYLAGAHISYIHGNAKEPP